MFALAVWPVLGPMLTQAEFGICVSTVARLLARRSSTAANCYQVDAASGLVELGMKSSKLRQKIQRVPLPPPPPPVKETRYRIGARIVSNHDQSMSFPKSPTLLLSRYGR